MVALPAGLALPLSVAAELVTAVAASDVTTGAPGVVKDITAPKLVPAALLAMAQKKYVAPPVSPVRAWVCATAVTPAPSVVPPAAGARVPKVSLHVPGSTVA